MEKIQQAIERARAQRAQAVPAQIVTQEDEEKLEPVVEQTRQFEAAKSFTPNLAHLEAHRILNDNSAPEVKQSYKLLRTRLLQKIKQNNWKSIAVVSALKSEGKSTVAINLAISLAKDMQHTAMLIDLDLINPCIHRYFGYQPELALSDYFQKNISLDQCLFSPGVNSLVVAPAGELKNTSSEYLASDQAKVLAQEVSQRYLNRVVIYDLPPLLASDDALAFLPNVDAVLMVVREGGSSKADIRQAMDMLSEYDLAGVVMNDAQNANPQAYS